MWRNMAEQGENIHDKQIRNLTEQNNFSESAKRLIKRQKETWPALSSGYNSLNFLKTKRIQFNGFTFVVQFNPGRYNSSSAKVDEKSINNRQCFLCMKNLPSEQESIIIKDYLLLTNPFPIFPEHFTIANIKHKNQLIKSNFKDLLLFSKILSKYYTVFYNGPQCGASAPDHLHFQAGSKYTMPIEDEYDCIKQNFGEILSNKRDCLTYCINDGLRKIISIEGRNEKYLTNIFNIFYSQYSSQSDFNEPMMNILCFYKEDKGWKVLIILRAKHRPEAFYKEGEEKILFSPAACDYGGLCITPLEKDYIRLDKNLLQNIFLETSISDIKFHLLKEKLKSLL